MKAVQLPTMADYKKIWKTILRSCGIGTVIGVLPAEGATVASMIGYSEARRWLVRLERFTREYDLYRWLLSVYLLQALAADRLGNHELARERFARALEIAAPQDYVRAVLDEGSRLLAYLPEVRSVAPEFVDRLAEVAEGQAGLPGLAPVQPVRRRRDPLRLHAGIPVLR